MPVGAPNLHVSRQLNADLCLDTSVAPHCLLETTANRASQPQPLSLVRIEQTWDRSGVQACTHMLGPEVETVQAWARPWEDQSLIDGTLGCNYLSAGQSIKAVRMMYGWVIFELCDLMVPKFSLHNLHTRDSARERHPASKCEP